MFFPIPQLQQVPEPSFWHGKKLLLGNLEFSGKLGEKKWGNKKIKIKEGSEII